MLGKEKWLLFSASCPQIEQDEQPPAAATVIPHPVRWYPWTVSQISPFSLKFLLSGHFITATGKVWKDSHVRTKVHMKNTSSIQQRSTNTRSQEGAGRMSCSFQREASPANSLCWTSWFHLGFPWSISSPSKESQDEKFAVTAHSQGLLKQR